MSNCWLRMRFIGPIWITDLNVESVWLLGSKYYGPCRLVGKTLHTVYLNVSAAKMTDLMKYLVSQMHYNDYMYVSNSIFKKASISRYSNTSIDRHVKYLDVEKGHFYCHVLIVLNSLKHIHHLLWGIKMGCRALMEEHCWPISHCMQDEFCSICGTQW